MKCVPSPQIPFAIACVHVFKKRSDKYKNVEKRKKTWEKIKNVCERLTKTWPKFAINSTIIFAH